MPIIGRSIAMPVERRGADSMHQAGTQSSGDLEAKCAEREELLGWLEALDGEGACPESVAIVRAQLERVLHDIARLKGAEAVGFSLPAGAGR